MNSDIENIKKKFSNQYRGLSLKYYPDKNPGDKEAEEQFKLLHKINHFLKNL